MGSVARFHPDMPNRTVCMNRLNNLSSRIVSNERAVIPNE